MFDLQLSFYRSLCYNSRDHCPLLQCLRTTSAILAGAQPYFVVSLFKCEGENSCDDLIPNPCILMKLNTTTHTFFFFVLINFSIIICIKVRSYTCPVPLSIGICFVCVEMFSNGVPWWTAIQCNYSVLMVIIIIEILNFTWTEFLW